MNDASLRSVSFQNPSLADMRAVTKGSFTGVNHRGPG